MPVSGKLDEISLALGELKAGQKNMKEAIDENRVVADRRHGENKARLDTIVNRVSAVETSASRMEKTVSKMEPVVEGFTITRWKLMGAFGVLTVIVGGLGWALSLVAGHVMTWVVSHIK